MSNSVNTINRLDACIKDIRKFKRHFCDNPRIAAKEIIFAADDVIPLQSQIEIDDEVYLKLLEVVDAKKKYDPHNYDSDFNELCERLNNYKKI